MLGCAAVEVQQQALAVDARAQAQLEVAVGALEHVARAARPVRERRQAGTRAALGVVQHCVGGAAQPTRPQAAGELDHPAGAAAVGGELGEQVRAALGGLAHARHELVEGALVQRLGRDHDPLFAQRATVGRHRPGRRAAHVGVVRAACRKADQLPAGAREDRRDHRDVGQVGAARERVVEDPRDPRGVVLVEHRRDRRRHRAQVDGDVLGLHDHLTPRVEERRRCVAALLDVGRVRGADQHQPHLLAGGA